MDVTECQHMRQTKQTKKCALHLVRQELTFNLALTIFFLVFYTDRKDFVQVLAHVISC